MSVFIAADTSGSVLICIIDVHCIGTGHKPNIPPFTDRHVNDRLTRKKSLGARRGKPPAKIALVPSQKDGRTLYTLDPQITPEKASKDLVHYTWYLPQYRGKKEHVAYLGSTLTRKYDLVIHDGQAYVFSERHIPIFYQINFWRNYLTAREAFYLVARDYAKRHLHEDPESIIKKALTTVTEAMGYMPLLTDDELAPLRKGNVKNLITIVDRLQKVALDEYCR